MQLSLIATEVVRLAFWLILLVAIFVPLERLFALHPAKIWRKEVGVDLAWYFINSIVPAAIIAIPLSIVATGMQRLDPGGFYSAVTEWPFWVRVPLAVIISDIGSYWAHRASHTIPFLWRFHAIHHSAEHLDWLVNTRAHPFDMVVTRLAGFIPIYLLGLAQISVGKIDPIIAVITIFATVWTFFIHSNIRVRLGPLEWLISSPAFHHWHHTNDENRDRNFASIFPILDVIFRTAWLPKYWPPSYGIDEKIPSTLAGQLMSPIDLPIEEDSDEDESKPSPVEEKRGKPSSIQE